MLGATTAQSAGYTQSFELMDRLPRNIGQMETIARKFPRHFRFTLGENGRVTYLAYPTIRGIRPSFDNLLSDKFSEPDFDTPEQIRQMKENQREVRHRRKAAQQKNRRERRSGDRANLNISCR